MANSGGNLGDLWFNLGIKENVSQDLNKILRQVEQSKGSVSELRKEFNKLVSGSDGNKSKTAFEKEWNKKVSNALDYLEMLQKIKKESDKIQTLKDLNKGSNVSALEQAQALLSKIKTDLLDIQKDRTFVGVDSADLGVYAKTLRNTLANVQALKEAFNRENSLSNASSNASRLGIELDKVKNKLAEIYAMQSSGVKGGYGTGMLLGAGNSLRGVKKRIESMLGNDELLNNEAKFKKLIEDIAHAYAKATGKIQEYRREKEKTSQAATEAERVGNAIERERERTEKQYLADLDKEAGIIQKNAQLREQAESQEYDRKKRQMAQQQAAQAAELKALSDYAKRYMELQQSKATADAKATVETENNARKMSNLYARLSHERDKAMSVSQKGTNLGVSTYDLDKVIAKASELRIKMRDVNHAAMGKDGNASYADYASGLNKLLISLHAATTAQKEMNAATLEAERAGNLAAMQNEAREAQELAQRYSELTRLKTDMQERDRQMSEHGAFVSMQNEAREAQELAQREQELARIKEAITRRSDEQAAAEKRLAEAIARVNQARQESIAKSRSAAESLVTSRVKELEEQRNQLLGLYSNGKSVLSVDELNQIRAAFSQITQEINTLRTAMNNLGSYSIGQLFSMGRGTSNYAPLVGSMEAVIKQKQEAIALEQKHQQEVAQTATKVRRDLVSAWEQAKNQVSGMNSTLQDMKSLVMQGGIVYGAQQFLMSIIQTGGELERQHIALQSILGDMQNADTMYGQIKQLALESPFTFSELNKDVKQLAAYGVEYDQLYDTTKRLADMASGLGVSFERIALAFGQVQARGWLDGKELRQISYAGIPLLDKLSRMYSAREGQKVSTSEVKTRISNRGVSFEDVKSVFWDMTDAGGQFYNMQQTLSETLLGRFNKLKDAWEIMLSDFASGTSKSGQLLMGVLNILTSIVQSMHNLGPVMLAAFSGFALNKAMRAAAGSTASSFLGNKAKKASEYGQQLAEGKTLQATERQILLTKNRITDADLRNLTTARALTQNDLNRLRVCGAITAAQYKTYIGIVAQQTATHTLAARWRLLRMEMSAMTRGNFWKSFATRGTAAFGMLKAGAASLGQSLWAAIGGLPGLLITAATSIFAYFYNKSEELKQEMNTVADELKDRYKSIGDLLNDMPAATIVARGDTKEIDNAIDEYKAKIKEIAPYAYNNLVMSAEEEASHKDRLKYLSEELDKIQKANTITQGKLASSDTYKDLKASLEDMSLSYDSVTSSAQNYGNGADSRLKASRNQLAFATFAQNMAQKVTDTFGDIAKDDKARYAAEQAMSSIMAQMEIPEDKANVIRASVLQSFGLVDGWLKQQVGSKMAQLLNESAPAIANKIRSGQQLTEAEQAKVRELMADAKQGLIWQYPELERTLQRLLDNSHFRAVIDLVVNDTGKYGKVQSTMSSRIPQVADKDTRDKYIQYVNAWGAEDSWYGARNKAKEVIDKAENELESAKKSNAPKEDISKLQSEYDTARNAAKDMLDYDYAGEGKKSNKEKNNNKKKEDTALKNWQERLSSYKSARQAYQKYKTVMGESAAKKSVEDLFDNIDGLSLDDYAQSIEKLEKELDFSKSPERRKALTSLKRELADWNFTEILKPQWERLSQDFQEALEDGLKSFDLYKTLLGKTGSKEFSMQAFGNGELWDDAAYNMAEKFRELTGGMEPDTSATDASAKHYLVDILGNQEAYDEWKKLTDYLHNGYNEALKESADIIEKTLNYEEQRTKLIAEYNTAMKKADALGGEGGEAIRRDATRKRDKGLADISLRQTENSSDYVKFFSRSIQQSKQTLSKYAEYLKTVLSDALQKGAISAEDYSKKIEEINARMRGLNDFKFAGGGLSGMTESQKAKGERQVQAGQSMYNSAKQAYDMAKTADEISSAKQGMEAGQSMMNGGSELMAGAEEMAGTISMIDQIIQGINNMVQGLNDTFQDIKETAEALGKDTDSDSWTDANSFFSGFSSASSSATSAWDSLKNGNMGGVLSGVVGSFTGWIKAFASGHDKKLDNQIKIAERQEQLLKTIANNVETVISNTLGGIYNYQTTDYSKKALESVKSDYEKRSALEAQLNGEKSKKGQYYKNGAADYISGTAGFKTLANGIKNLFSNPVKKLKNAINKIVDYSEDTYKQVVKALNSGTAYDAELASLMAQRDTLRQQRNAEASKKKSDQSKLNDYDSQIEEMRQKIQSFAQDFLKSIYSVDMKSWASELTDAVVSAWSAGEDAVDAYKEKVKDLVKDLTKNILSQKIMEQALQKPLDYLTGLLEEKGQLDEGDMEQLAEQLYEAGEDSVSNITGILDALKKKGLDLSEDSSSSTSNSIKSITEETADLLAAYLNAIRLDVSAIRGMEAAKLTDMGEIQKSQLEQLRSISQNTLRNAEAAERIEVAVTSLNDNFDRVLTGTKSLKVR